METLNANKADRHLVADSLARSVDFMGMSKSDLSDILLIDPSSLNRSLKSGIEPKSLKGQVSLLVIKVYRSLFALAGNNKNFMSHFLYTENKYFDARPVDVMKTVDGLVSVNHFLDAMRGKV